MSERNMWDVVHDYPGHSFIIILAAIWSFERITKTIVKRAKTTPEQVQQSQPQQQQQLPYQ